MSLLKYSQTSLRDHEKISWESYHNGNTITISFSADLHSLQSSCYRHTSISIVQVKLGPKHGFGAQLCSLQGPAGSDMSELYSSVLQQNL